MKKRWSLCLLSATFVLTACSTPADTDVKPNGVGSSSSSASGAPSSTTSVSPTPPSDSGTSSLSTTTAKPGAASEASALAFVQLFSQQANLAYQRNQPELIQNLYTPACKTCAAMTDQINKYKNLEQSYQGEVVHPTSTTISSYTAGKSAKVFVSSATDAVKVLDASGALVKTFPASTGGLIFTLDFTAGWRVASIQASS